MCNEEIWKGVIYQGIDYSWRFEVSNKGRIRNAINKHIYIPHICGIGYYQICTSINNIRKNIKIHKAIAESFLDNPNNLRDVNHKDGNKLNNNLENLEWVSHRDNSLHAIKNGLLDIRKGHYNSDGTYKYKGEDNSCSKLTEDAVKYIRKHYKTYNGCSSNKRELAKMFGVDPMTIYYAYKGITWKHLD